MACFSLRLCAHSHCASLAMAAALGLMAAAGGAHAAVTPTGDVSPALPPAGGSISSLLRVGNTGYGTLSINAGTPLSVLANSAVVGDTADGIGIMLITALGSNFSTANDLTIGNEGTGSITVEKTANITLTDDLFLGIASAASGDLFVTDLGTVVDVGGTIVVASAGNSLVQVTTGGRVNADTSIVGQFAGSDGRLTISGNNSTLAQMGGISIGDAGRGEFQVISQGTARTTNASIGVAAAGTGVAVVSGAGSNWKITGSMNLGLGGMGTINVLDGGLLTMTGALRQGTVSGSESHAVISGANTVMTIGTTATVGELGFATFDVRGGAHVTSGNAIVADNSSARGEVLVDGVGSLWRITGTLDVSEPGEAQLAITSGAQVTTTGVVRIGAAGRVIMSTGRLEAGGAGVTNNGIIQGTGRIIGNVNNSTTGKVRIGVGNAMIMASALTNSGLVDLDGSELEVLGVVNNNSDVDMRNATLRSGGLGLDNNAGAQLAITEGTGDIYGAVDNNVGAQIIVGGKSTAVFHDNLLNSGQVFVFPGSGILTLENLTFEPSSSLNLQVGLIEETAQAATVEAAGAATLSGGLAVTLAPGYAPGLGDEFRLLTAAGGVSGMFATAALPVLGGGLSWDLDYEPNHVTIAVIGGFSADFNLDGKVDAADLTKWKVGFGKTTGAVQGDGDADGNGRVDGSDFLSWQRQVGSGLASTAAAANVPEPATWSLAAGLLGLATSRIRRKSRAS